MAMMTQQQISDENEAYLEDQAVERDEAMRQADIDYAQAQRSNAAQPRGRWDAGTQTFVPDDPTHGKASRKWNPGGVSQWDQALQQQRDGNFAQVLAQELAAQGRMWGEFSSVMNAVKQKRAQTGLAMQHSTACAMRSSMENGGQAPQETVALWNRINGHDGKTSGLASCGFLKNGTFVMRMIGSDENGRPVVQEVPAELPQQLVTMTRNREIFGNDAIYAVANKMQEVGYSPREIENYAYMGGGGQTIDSYRANGGFGDGSAGGRNIGGTTDGKAASRLFGRGGDNRSRISVFGTGGAGTGYTMREYNGHTGEDTGFVDDPIRQSRTADLANGSWSVVESGPRRVSDAYVDENGERAEARYENGKRYRNSVTGEEVWVKDGDPLPRRRDSMSEKERIASMQEDGKNARANARNATNLTRADIEARLKEMGFNLKKEQLDGLMQYRTAKLGQNVTKDQADAAAKELAALRKSISESGGTPTKEQTDRMNRLQGVVDGFAGIGGGDESGKEPSPVEKMFGGKMKQLPDGGANGVANGGVTQSKAPNADDQKRKEIEAIRAQKAKLQNSQHGSVNGGGYGLRNDGKTYKGTGWLGELKTADGGVATEYTSQSEAVKVNGKRIDFPTLVPTLTKDEVELMVNDIIPNKKPVPDEIMQKAVDHARMRLANGQSVFANDGKPPSKSMELRIKNAERMKKKPVVDKNGVVDMDSEDGRYRIWYVEHGSSSLSKEENWKRFKEYDEKTQARLKILGKGPKEDRWSRLH